MWIEADAKFPSTAREFAFHEGSFVRLEQRPTGLALRRYDNVQVMAAQFVRELIEGWFASSTGAS
jgi:hypothetical protein